MKIVVERNNVGVCVTSLIRQCVHQLDANLRRNVLQLIAGLHLELPLGSRGTLSTLIEI